MRGTLHLVAAREYPLYFSAFSLYKHFRANSWLKYHGITQAELDTLLAGLPEILTDQPMTREQLADAIAAKLNAPHLRELLLSGWGALLKPASFQGFYATDQTRGKMSLSSAGKVAGRLVAPQAGGRLDGNHPPLSARLRPCYPG